MLFNWSGSGLAQISYAMDALSSGKSHRAYQMALNRTGERTFTVVKRVLAPQVGLTQKVVVERGAMRLNKAHGGSLAVTVTSSGSHLPLRLFKARQTREGVTAAPWGKRRLFRGTFTVGSAGGNVFRRLTKDRLPIKKLWGPAIPKEMVKDASAKAFHEVVASELPKRVGHEIRRATAGAVS